MRRRQFLGATLGGSAMGLLASRMRAVADGDAPSPRFIFIYTPVAGFLFTTTPIALWVWGLMVAVSLSVLVVEEARKWIFRHFHVFEEYLEPGAEVSDQTL